MTQWIVKPDRPLVVLVALGLALVVGLPAHAQAPTADWTHRFGGDGNENVQDIAIDTDGRAYLVGITDGEFAQPAEGFFDGFVHAVAPDDTVDWTRQIHTGDVDVYTSIAVAPDGDVLIAGVSDGPIDGPSAGGDDAFVMRLSPDGEERWRAARGTPERDDALALAIDADGTIYVGGTSEGGLGGEPVGGEDGFLTALAPDGQERWRHAIATDANEELFAATALPDGGDVPVFTAAITSDGSTRWMTGLGLARRDMGQDVALAADGTIVVIATTEADVVSENAGVADALICGLDGDGTVLWSQQLGSARFDDGWVWRYTF